MSMQVQRPSHRNGSVAVALGEAGGIVRRSFLVLAVPLSACVSHGGVHPLRPHDLATGPYQSVATAAFTGSLLYEAGCLVFRDEDNNVQLLPVWPFGSEFNGSLVIFHQPGKAEQRIVVGEEFQMEGQPVAWSALPSSTTEDFQRTCGSPPFAVSRVRPAN
jgi:hypothetical protein